MLTKEAYMALYEKYIAGKCSPDELRLLESYRDTFELQEMSWDEVKMGNKADVKKRIHGKLEKEIGGLRRNNPKTTIYIWSRYIAAAVLLIITLVYLGMQNNIIPGIGMTQIDSPIVPGGNKALLTMEDGTHIALDQAGIGDVANHGLVRVHKPEDGRLDYQQLEGANFEKAIYHTLSTPRGGQYQLNLSDGTKVWLNAASSIRFPTTFTESERVVEIVGEVYFEVQKQTDKPFVVVANDQRISVLGTSFNVKAYPDEGTVETALLEGKVMVNIRDRGYALIPGQQTIFDKENGRVQITPFVIEEAIAWQSGYFIFGAEHIESVMRKIARWYDVEVIYEGNMEGKFFSGTMSRYEQVEDVLDMLTLTGTVKFKIEGRRIFVME